MQTTSGPPLNGPPSWRRRAPATRSAATERRRRCLVLFVLVAALVWLVDAVTKAMAVAWLSGPVPVLDGVLTLRLTRNPGAAFSTATGYTVILSLVACAVVVVVIRLAGRLTSPGWAVALGLFLGGALGNLTDRIVRAPGPLRGHVVDFLQLPHWPIFNVADSAITAAAALVVLLSLLGRSLGPPRPARAAATRDRQPGSGEPAPGDSAPGDSAPGDSTAGERPGRERPSRDGSPGSG